MTKNKMHDLRDKTTCPSFANLKHREVRELASLLVKALKGQIKALSEVENHDKLLLNELKNYLNKIEKSYVKFLRPSEEETQKNSTVDKPSKQPEKADTKA